MKNIRKDRFNKYRINIYFYKLFILILLFISLFLIFLNNSLFYQNYYKEKLFIKKLFNKNKAHKNKESYIDIDNEINLFEDNNDYSNYSTDIKTIALYLPQYYFMLENDKWWGKNYTEWTNVKKAVPLFYGHHQPRKPGDMKGYLGYYHLTNPEAIKKQIKLAKSHGIYGFGIYYYWFSGKRLLDKPLDIFLLNKYIEFPFLLIWANHNWFHIYNNGKKKL